MKVIDRNGKVISVGDIVSTSSGITYYKVHSITPENRIILAAKSGNGKPKGYVYNGSYKPNHFELVNRRNNLKDNDPLGLLDIK